MVEPCPDCGSDDVLAFDASPGERLCNACCWTWNKADPIDRSAWWAKTFPGVPEPPRVVNEKHRPQRQEP